MPLITKGVQAFRLMARESAWAPSAACPSDERSSGPVKRALGHEDIIPYDLRHFFGNELDRRSNVGSVSMSTAIIWVPCR